MRDKELYAQILGLNEPWVVEEVELLDDKKEIVIRVGLRGSIILICPFCNEPMPGYDSQKRRWRHLDTCQYQTLIEANVPRGQCALHGVKQIGVPWAEGRSQFTALFERLVIDWLKGAAQSCVAGRLGLSWDEVHGIMKRAVDRGLQRRPERSVSHIGVDEKSVGKHHEYVTVVCDTQQGNVLYVGDDRKKESLDAFYRQLTPDQREAIEAVSMDMWEAFIQSTQEHVPNAKDKIVFDKFHVVKHLNEAVDKVRRSEHKALLGQGDSPLTGTKYLWLKNPKNFSRDNRRDFSSLRESHLKTARAWAIKQTAMELWGYTYVGVARRFFDKWYSWAIRSRLDPIKKVARMMKERLENILTYLKERVTNALAEGINSMIQWIKYTARGFRNRQNFKTAILFHLGGLDLYPH